MAAASEQIATTQHLPSALGTMHISDAEAAAVVDSVQAARAASTLRMYDSHLRTFAAWLQSRGLLLAEGAAVPAEVLALYMQHMFDGGKSINTISAHVAAISVWHRKQALPSPASNTGVRDLMAGLRRRTAEAIQAGDMGRAVRRAEAAEWASVRRMVAAVDHTANETLRLRDRALLLVGMASGCRRAELAAIKFEHVEWCAEGVLINLPHTKTGRPRIAEITPNTADRAMCPVLALRAWLDHAAISTGPVFRQVSITPHGRAVIGDGIAGQVVGRTVAKYAAAAGLPPGRWSGHSLRAGYAVQATIDGVPESAIREQTGHTSSQLYVYTQRGRRFSVARNRYGSPAA